MHEQGHRDPLAGGERACRAPAAGWTELTSSASRMRSSVVLPMALTTTTTSSPCAAGPGDVVGHGADAVGVADRGPAELLDDERHRRDATAGPGTVHPSRGRLPVGCPSRAHARSEPASGPAVEQKRRRAQRRKRRRQLTRTPLVVGDPGHRRSSGSSSARRRGPARRRRATTTTSSTTTTTTSTGRRRPPHARGRPPRPRPTPRPWPPAARPARRRRSTRLTLVTVAPR